MKQFSLKIMRRREKLLKFISKHKLATIVSGAISYLIFGTIIFGLIFCLNPSSINMFFTTNESFNKLDCIAYALRMGIAILILTCFEIWIYWGVIREHPNKNKIIIVYTMENVIAAIVSYIISRRIFIVCLAMVLIGVITWIILYEYATVVLAIILSIFIIITIVIPMCILCELKTGIFNFLEKLKDLIKEFKEEVLS